MSTTTVRCTPSIRVYLCECGPIIRDALDIERLRSLVEREPGVDAVVTYSTICSAEGREWLRDDLRAHSECRVVVAGCSPREHGTTLMEICRGAGINPYVLSIANIREQCTWVTPDRVQALRKAVAAVRAAVARARVLEPLEEREVECSDEALVVGGGVAGLTAAQLLARAGRRVCLVERAPVLGGRVALLDQVYPGFECAPCMLERLLDDVLHDERIEVLTCSEVEDVVGSVGAYSVRVRKRARGVDPDKCFACRTCQEACPASVDNEFEAGMVQRKAIYIPYEGALPNASVIDRSHCLQFHGKTCTACADACPFGAIDLEAEDTVVERHAGAIVVAAGAVSAMPECVRSSCVNVVTADVLERLLSSAGPTGGRVALPGRKSPRSIVLVWDLAGSVNAGADDWIGSVGNRMLVKYQAQLQAKLPECRVQVLYLRGAANSGSDEGDDSGAAGYQAWTAHDTETGAEVEHTRNGRTQRTAADLVVVWPRFEGPKGVEKLIGRMRVKLDAGGFVTLEHRHLRPYRTTVEGIYVAGSSRGPSTVRDAAAEAAAAAGAILSYLVPGRRLRVEPATALVDEHLCGGCRSCVRACPFGAIAFDGHRRSAVVDELLCRGCGSCSAACPAGAVTARHYTDEQLKAESKSYVADDVSTNA